MAFVATREHCPDHSPTNNNNLDHQATNHHHHHHSLDNNNSKTDNDTSAHHHFSLVDSVLFSSHHHHHHSILAVLLPPPCPAHDHSDRRQCAADGPGRVLRWKPIQTAPNELQLLLQMRSDQVHAAELCRGTSLESNANDLRLASECQVHPRGLAAVPRRASDYNYNNNYPKTDHHCPFDHFDHDASCNDDHDEDNAEGDYDEEAHHNHNASHAEAHDNHRLVHDHRQFPGCRPGDQQTAGECSCALQELLPVQGLLRLLHLRE